MKRAAERLGTDVSGTVRITASEVMGVEVLPPIVAKLQSEHPALKVELVLTNRVQDLLRREADIAVRMALPKQDLLIARRVGTEELGFHAHQEYLDDHGTPHSLAELAQLALIRSGAGIGICQAVLAKRDPQLVRVLPDHFANNMETWLTIHEDLRHSPRCKITFDALLAGLQHHVNQALNQAVALERPFNPILPWNGRHG